MRSWHIVLVLTIIGGFLRFYNLQGTVQFLGDQGRDALIVHRLLIDRDPVFIGPVTSVGNMYLGPAYYYFMLPFYALTYPSPMGPVYAVAFIGTLTIPALYFLGKELVGNKAALFATTLFTFTWVVIQNTRFSWNPNPAPLVSLIMIWATYRAWTKDPRYWLLVSAMFSVLIQLHYLTLLSLGGAGIVWLISLYEQFRLPTKKRQIKTFFIATIVSLCIFALSLTPLALFDLKHNFLNSRAFAAMITGDGDQVRGARNIFAILRETEGRSFHILFETLGSTTRWLNKIMLGVVLSVLAYCGVRMHRRDFGRGEVVVAIWLVVGIIGTSFYSSSVFDHYIAYLFPITALTFGIVMAILWKTWMSKPFALVVLAGFLILNVKRYHYVSLSWTIDDVQRVATEISRKVEPGEKYNVVLLAEHGDLDGMNYRYFLTANGEAPVFKEHYEEVEKLFIINETGKPTDIKNSSIFEIHIFPEKEPTEVFRVSNGTEITVLTTKR